MAHPIFRSTPRSRRHRPPHQEVQPETQTAFFQPKLSINQPGDPYEREADAVADAVVNQSSRPAASQGQTAVQRMPISSVQRLATPEEDKMPATNDERMAEDKKIQEKPEGSGGLVQKAEMEEEEPVQAKEEEEEPVQAKSQPGASQPSLNFSVRLGARRGQGAPLPAKARAQMEQGIGADFSQVRIHTDSEAVQMNKNIHAQAFTQGRDVYFNSGKFDPSSTEGKRLLAH